jgi:hypothetical protein
MPSIWSRRFTVVFVDRTSGVGRRATIHLGWTLAAVAFLFTVPVLVGLGIRWRRWRDRLLQLSADTWRGERQLQERRAN